MKLSILILSVIVCFSVITTQTSKYIAMQNPYNSSDVHLHYHVHNGSNHSHSHTHTQINIVITDFFIDTTNRNSFTLNLSKQKYSNIAIFIPTPISHSLFRPPIS